MSEALSTQPADQAPGAAETVEPAAAASEQAPADPKPTETVEFWKSKARHWETLSKANADKARQYDELQDQAKSDLERAQEAAQRATELASSYLERAVVGEAKALASDFANPEVAVRLLGDVQGYVSDGQIDTDRLRADLDDLLKREPYLARVQAPAGMRPNPAQGQSGAPSLSPSQRAAESERNGDWKAAAASKADLLLQLRQGANH